MTAPADKARALIAAAPLPLPPGTWREPGGVAARLSEEMLRRLLVARPSPDLPAPFDGIKTKPDDLWSVALLHGWAEVLDILAFYQTHILGEGYIGTATEPLSRQLLLSQLGLERGRRSALAAAPRPGAPQPIVLDPGCAATADFIFGLRPAPGLPPVTVLPAGAQLRRHSVDAPNVMIFETERAVSLKAEWANLPLSGQSVSSQPLLTAGAAGALTDRRDVAPSAGDRMLFTDRDHTSIWTRRTVTAVSTNAWAGLCEVAFDTPLGAAINAPEALVYTRRAPLFGWNAADFSSLPTAVRLAAVQGQENTLEGGVRIDDSKGMTRLNIGLSAAAPRAVGVAPDGTVYLASDDGLYWAPRGTEPWRRAPGSAAVRDIGVMTVAPDGLLMLGGASGNVWVGRDPAAGFDSLIGGYVLEADPAPLKAPRPIKATLPGGPARALFAVGQPTSRVLAQTDAGLFEYDPKGFWLSVSASPLGLHPFEHGEPIQTRLNGRRLAACLVSDDRHFGLLAYGLEVEIVRLGPAVPPPAPVAGGDGTKAPEPAIPSTPEKPGWAGGLIHWVEGLLGHGHPAPSPPVPRKAPHRSGAWLFDSPVLALAPLASATGHGWSSFLAADANGVYRVDRDGAPVKVDAGLPGPVTRFLVQPDGDRWIVRVALPTGVYRFDPSASNWSLEIRSETTGPLVAAAAHDRLVVAESLVLPPEWPGFDLPSGTLSIDLAGQGLDLAPGEIIVLTDLTGEAQPAAVVSATPLAIDAFGLRERVLRVVFRLLPQAIPDPTPPVFARRTTVVDISGRAVRLVAPPDARRTLLGPDARLDLLGDWDGLGQPEPQAVGPSLPTSGVAGGDRRALPPDMGAMLAWGGQPIDMSGVAARAASPISDVASDAPRLAVIGPKAMIVPQPLGGVLSLGGQSPVRALPGMNVRALAVSGKDLLAATAGQGVFRQTGAAGPWSPVNAGLPAGALTVTAMTADAAGAVVIATSDGLHRLEPGGTEWTLLGASPSPAVPITALCVLSSGVVMAGGKAGLFALNAGAWTSALGGVMPTASAITALAAWKDGCLAAPASGGLLFTEANIVWSVWSASMAITRIEAIRPDGEIVLLASDSGLFSATAGGATRLVMDKACDTVDVSGDAVLVGVSGDGVYLSIDSGGGWRRLSPGLSNALTAVALCSPSDPRAAAGTGLMLRADGGVAMWNPAPVQAVLPTTLAAALDAGLTLPLRAALPSDLAKAAPDGAVVAVITPKTSWTFGAPGKGLGQGAMLLSLRTDGIAVSTPTDAFVVEAATGVGPSTLTLSSTVAEGQAEAWLDELIAVASDQVPVTEVRSLSSVVVATDSASTAVTLDKPLGVLLDAAGTTCTANVATASQGETVAGEILGDGDAGRTFQGFTLRRAPLTFVEGQDGVSRPVLNVYVNGVEWSPVGSLVGSSPSDRVYTLRINAGGQGEIGFGDGVTGARLPNGRGNVTATYRTGMAPIQTLEAGVTTLLMSRPSVSRVDGVIRTPGRAPVSGEAQSRVVQASLRSLGRLVTAGDYATFLETCTQVGSAVVDELEVRGRPFIYVTVALAGGKSADALGFSLDQARRAVAAAQAIPAPPFEVGLAAVSRVRVAATIWIEATAKSDAVEAAARDAVTALLGPASPIIGQARRLAEVEDALQRVAGVAGVSVDGFYIAGRSQRANLRLEAPRARRLPSGRYSPATVLVLDTAQDAVDLTILKAGGRE